MKFNSLVNLDIVNKKLSKLSSIDRINYLHSIFKDQLFALSSAGIDSGLMIDHLLKSKNNIPVLHIDTGFLPKETIEFKNELEKYYKNKFIRLYPNKEDLRDIKESKLWVYDPDLYSKMTKIEPLNSAIRRLNIKALMSGARSDQNENRASLNFVEKGINGELRVYTFLVWSSGMVHDYINNNNLPVHKLKAMGFDSVGDAHSTLPGENRAGRQIYECGINVVSGKPIIEE